jgi:hypothetical protein
LLEEVQRNLTLLRLSQDYKYYLDTNYSNYLFMIGV